MELEKNKFYTPNDAPVNLEAPDDWSLCRVILRPSQIWASGMRGNFNDEGQFRDDPKGEYYLIAFITSHLEDDDNWSAAIGFTPEPHWVKIDSLTRECLPSSQLHVLTSVELNAIRTILGN